MRVWFNHWFSTAYRLMELLKQGDNSIEIIGTNTISSCVYKDICNEFYVEPVLSDGNDYVSWCLQFCKLHNINVFIPRRHREDIVRNISKFNVENIKVMACSDLKLIEMLENKYETALYFKKYNICDVPPLYVVNDAISFTNAYNELKSLNISDKICVKYSQDEGAISFKIIDNSLDNVENLRFNTANKISNKSLLEILNRNDKFEDLVVMPYLEGPEISVDSLMTSKGFIGVSRVKIGTRGTLVKYDDICYNISKKFAEISGITMPYNLQLRYHRGKLYLLEVNTRMAGGTHKSCLAGINIPYIAYCELLNINYSFPVIKWFNTLLVSQIETPIILDTNFKED